MEPRVAAILAAVSDHYAVDAEVGRGGMGVVFRGRDLRLDRPVAIKMLVEAGADDEKLGARLRREAQIMASLQHPHIASVYALEEPQPGTLLLVLEWVDGPTLAQLLQSGPLPVRDALETCRQVAEALATAHERRIIHRDLKPSNVMFGVGGVKVLDFGIARQITGRDDGVSTSITGQGEVLGTARYMSPEHVLSERLDTRSDVFSFGCLLFECLTGRPAFEGRSAAESMAAVLHVEPPWASLPAALPHPIRRLLFDCLAKARDRRPQDIREVRDALADVIDGSPTGTDEGAAYTPLPVEMTRFVGRQDELARCEALLIDHRLVTLTGPGGAGKTRLAIQVAQRARARHAGGVHLVDLVPVGDPRRIEPAVAAALQIPEEPDRPLADTIEAALRDRDDLLVLDNCEHLLADSAAFAGALLGRCPSLRILATSREPLGLPGEQNFPVPPLSLPGPGSRDAGAVLASEAVQLFLDRARLIAPDLAVDDTSMTAVAEVCRRLDGIPLAIEIAAARVRALSVQEIQQRLDDRLRLLPGRSGTTGRHQTLLATFQWSYDLLDDDERRGFRSLAVFAGGWPLEAAARIWNTADEEQALDRMEHLVSKSLVTAQHRAESSSRYRLLETLRQFAWSKLEERGEVAGLRDQHLVYYLERGEAAEQALWGPTQATWLAWLDREHDNLLWALDWALQKPAGDDGALRLTGSLRRFWSIRGHFAVGARALDAALRHDARALPTRARGRALDGRANLALYAGDYVRATAAFEESLTVHRSLGDAQGIARALTGLGHVATQQREYPAARARYEESLATSRSIDDTQGIAAALGNLGGIAIVQGDYATASVFMAECVEKFEQMGNLHNTAIGLASLGFLATKLGDVAAARTRLHRCLTLVRDLRATRAGAAALESTAESAHATGDLEHAARFFAAADGLRQACGAPLGPDEKRQQDEIVAQVRAGLDAARFTQAWAEGRDLSFEAAVGGALNWLAASPAPAQPAAPSAPHDQLAGHDAGSDAAP